jgi:hypothetical protein
MRPPSRARTSSITLSSPHTANCRAHLVVKVSLTNGDGRQLCTTITGLSAEEVKCSTVWALHEHHPTTFLLLRGFSFFVRHRHHALPTSTPSEGHGNNALLRIALPCPRFSRYPKILMSQSKPYSDTLDAKLGQIVGVGDIT